MKDLKEHLHTNGKEYYSKLNLKKQCGNCKFWEKTTNYENVENQGLCSEIREKVYIDFIGDGYINYIETDEDFCCSLHQN
jgi:hypothetical protein